MTNLRNLFQQHWDSVKLGDMDALTRDYADDAILIRPDRMFSGHSGCREFFTELFDHINGFAADHHSFTTANPVLLL